MVDWSIWLKGGFAGVLDSAIILKMTLRKWSIFLMPAILLMLSACSSNLGSNSLGDSTPTFQFYRTDTPTPSRTPTAAGNLHTVAFALPHAANASHCKRGYLLGDRLSVRGEHPRAASCQPGVGPEHAYCWNSCFYSAARYTGIGNAIDPFAHAGQPAGCTSRSVTAPAMVVCGVLRM